MTVSLDEMIRSVGRELGKRRAVYPGWIKAKRHFAGKLFTQETADHEIACMDAIYGLLKSLKSVESFLAASNEASETAALLRDVLDRMKEQT